MPLQPSATALVSPRSDRRGPQRPLRVLTFVHRHPDLRAGGAQLHALEIHRAMRDSARFEPLLVAAEPRLDVGRATDRSPRRFSSDHADELLWNVVGFDDFLSTARDKTSYTRGIRPLLRSFRPHVVHVQHTESLGLDLLTEIRHTIPGTPIVYTLHEFLPICHSRGLMLRRGTDERCTGASAWRCHSCFPEHAPDDFFLRRRFIRQRLELVDLFLAPSHALRERYVDWGLPAERIRFQDYGRPRPAPRLDPPEPLPSSRSFAFLGQAMRHKGILVLLEAMELLLERGVDVRLEVHGAHLDLDGDDYVREVRRRIRRSRGRVTLTGSYEPEEVPRLLRGAGWVVVPSIWWENSPLVIQEAFLCGRPVICSDIGGMAEKVRDGVDGLHFAVGRPGSLARVLERAAGNDALWERLRAGIPEVYSIEEALDDLERTFEELLPSQAESEVEV